MRPQLLVNNHVLGLQLLRPAHQGLRLIGHARIGVRHQLALHGIECPEQIHRGWSTGAQRGIRLGHALPPHGRLGVPLGKRLERHAIGGGHPDGGRTAHHHIAYGLGHLAGRTAAQRGHTQRQGALVEQFKPR